MSDLANAMQQLTSLRFPEHAESDTLDRLLLELAEFDGYIAGLAGSVFGGENPRALRVKDLRELETSIREVGNLSASDRAIRAHGLHYIAALATVREALISAGCRGA